MPLLCFHTSAVNALLLFPCYLLLVFIYILCITGVVYIQADHLSVTDSTCAKSSACSLDSLFNCEIVGLSFIILFLPSSAL